MEVIAAVLAPIPRRTAATLALFLAPVGAGLIGTWLPAFGYFPALGGTSFSLAPWTELWSSPGLGTGVRVWVEGELPPIGQVDWAQVHDIPVGLVTGTNGKSTTVRLAAAIAAAAGRTPGLCSSDWVRAGDEIIAEGDYSGPGGARLAVRARATTSSVQASIRA